MTPEPKYLVTTSVAAGAAGVTVSAIHQWAFRGYLTNYGSGRTALWDWREVAQVKATRGQRRRAA